MGRLENHPLIPEQSEEHNTLIGSLVDIQGYTGDPRVANRIFEQDDGLELIETLGRIRIGPSGEVTKVAYPEDADYSPEAPPHYLSDEELSALVRRAADALGRVEHGTGDQ